MRSILEGTRNLEFLKEFVSFADGRERVRWNLWLGCSFSPPLTPLTVIVLTSQVGDGMEIWNARCLSEPEKAGCESNQH